MDYLEMILTSLIGTAGFAIIFRLKPTHILPAALGGALTCAAYALFDSMGAALFLSNFLASLFGVLYSCIMAKLLKTPSTIFVALCIIPLVPGSSLFYTMSHLLVWSQSEFMQSAGNALQIALGIAGGIVLESAVVHFLGHLPGKRAPRPTGHS